MPINVLAISNNNYSKQLIRRLGGAEYMTPMSYRPTVEDCYQFSQNEETVRLTSSNSYSTVDDRIFEILYNQAHGLLVCLDVTDVDAFPRAERMIRTMRDQSEMYCFGSTINSNIGVVDTGYF
eukprot:TRINITY_DN1972_c0_g1_i4.p1 TRINITY_DN1972_c0_g1~~TRINITY_DN1972_c0_g1_i4.p1  ORF type:complete len:123 (-),score=20.13 TRINITY_DN1972_c0_g1_i4:449-817(-)